MSIPEMLQSQLAGEPADSEISGPAAFVRTMAGEPASAGRGEHRLGGRAGLEQR